MIHAVVFLLLSSSFASERTTLVFDVPDAYYDMKLFFQKTRDNLNMNLEVRYSSDTLHGYATWESSMSNMSKLYVVLYGENATPKHPETFTHKAHAARNLSSTPISLSTLLNSSVATVPLGWDGISYPDVDVILLQQKEAQEKQFIRDELLKDTPDYKGILKILIRKIK